MAGGAGGGEGWEVLARRAGGEAGPRGEGVPGGAGGAVVGAGAVAVGAGGVAGQAGALRGGELLGATGGGAGAKVRQQVVASLTRRAQAALIVRPSYTGLVTGDR